MSVRSAYYICLNEKVFVNVYYQFIVPRFVLFFSCIGIHVDPDDERQFYSLLIIMFPHTNWLFNKFP